MKLQVELNKTSQIAKAIFAERLDPSLLNDWRELLNGTQSQVRTDAVDFAELALSRFLTQSKKQAYAKSVEDIGFHVKHDPKCEVASFVLLTCDWFPDSRIIGLSHFHRTWNNNIFLDFLVAHPYIAEPPPAYPHEVGGVGKALLYFVSCVAKRYECSRIFGEATQHSASFYGKQFFLDSLDDMIYAPRENFIEFIQKYESKSKGVDTSMPSNETAFDKAQNIETEDPLAGRRNASASRTLAYHFLDLPFHVQIEIAKILGLMQDIDKDQTDIELFRRFFRRATEEKKLEKLWNEVEKRRPNGELGKNPFHNR